MDAVVTLAVVEELPRLLLVWGEELNSREGAIIAPGSEWLSIVAQWKWLSAIVTVTSQNSHFGM
jgi:hypothetical protein